MNNPEYFGPIIILLFLTGFVLFGLYKCIKNLLDPTLTWTEKFFGKTEVPTAQSEPVADSKEPDEEEASIAWLIWAFPLVWVFGVGCLCLPYALGHVGNDVTLMDAFVRLAWVFGWVFGIATIAPIAYTISYPVIVLLTIFSPTGPEHLPFMIKSMRGLVVGMFSCHACAAFLLIAGLSIHFFEQGNRHKTTAPSNPESPQPEDVTDEKPSIAETIGKIASAIDAVKKEGRSEGEQIVSDRTPPEVADPAAANAVLTALEQADAVIGLRKVVGKGLWSTQSAKDWAKAARKDVDVGSNLDEVIDDLSHSKLGLAWMIKTGDEDPVSLEDWIRENVEFPDGDQVGPTD